MVLNQAKLYYVAKSSSDLLNISMNFLIIKADGNIFCFSFGSSKFIYIDNFGVHGRKEI